MLGAVSSFVYLLISLGILVTIHELGHFLAARACGVKVLRFSIGFGQVLFKRTGKDGCEYAISAIPLGGYVKMEGENEEDPDKKLSENSFKSKSVLKRAIIIFAGPFFNIVLSFVLFTIVNMGGIAERIPVIGDVVPDSKAYAAGLKVNDRIDSIGGKNVASWQEVMLSFLKEVGSDNTFEIEVTRDFGKGQSYAAKLNFADMSLSRGESPIENIGLKPCIGKATNRISVVVDNSPAQKASLMAGDVIEQINGESTPNWYRITDAIVSSNCAPMEFTVRRDDKLYSTTVTPVIKSETGKPYVGIGADIEPIEGLVYTVDYNFFEAAAKAVDDCARMSKLVLVSLYKLVNGSISAKNISGPISIANGARDSADLGIRAFFIYLALISVNLGIFNLLPVPVLDGGQLMFLAYEAVMKKEPSVAVQRTLTIVGFAVLLSLMIFAIFNDIVGLTLTP